jgi:hypothetical protein
MPERCETDVPAILRPLLTCKRTFALLEPSAQLALQPASTRASWHETRLRSFSPPYWGLCSHWSRQTSGAQVDEPGGSLYATPTLSR